MSYNSDNIFARILRGEIPCDKILENDHVLAFRDIDAKAKQHILVIPKGAYSNINDIAKHGSDAEMAALFRAVNEITQKLDLEQSGFRLIVNTGSNGGQEVPHLHLHILGGEPLGPMLSKK